MLKYGLEILWSDEDQGFIATCADFPGLSAFGETEEEALAEGKVARGLFIESLQNTGDVLPEATLMSDCSGQLRLRMPPTLHFALVQKAKREKVSLNTWINYLLTERNSTHKILDEISSRITKIETAIQTQREETRQILIEKETTYNPFFTQDESYGKITSILN